ncbi:hypothetical protein, partial [Nonomuraea aridisoli]
MDELSAVRERLAAPGPSPETAARGRALLMRAIDEERTRLRDTPGVRDAGGWAPGKRVVAG